MEPRDSRLVFLPSYPSLYPFSCVEYWRRWSEIQYENLQGDDPHSRWAVKDPNACCRSTLSLPSFPPGHYDQPAFPLYRAAPATSMIRADCTPHVFSASTCDKPEITAVPPATPGPAPSPKERTENSPTPAAPTARKARRNRTTFTAPQLVSLEREFISHKYVNGLQRTALSRILGLTEEQIKIWWQNRRIKERRASCSRMAETSCPDVQ